METTGAIEDLRERQRLRQAQWLEYTETRQRQEIQKCWHPEYGVFYFVENYVSIENPQIQSWIPFTLWQEQWQTLKTVHENQLSCVLKARQMGLTWLLADAYPAWLMLFRPGSSIGIWSLTQEESIYLLDDRLKKMLGQLPPWMMCDINIDNKTLLDLWNGSDARAFPHNRGDGHTFTYGVVDEADLLPLDELLKRIKPAIDNGGKLVALSRSDKSNPASAFKNIFRGAMRGENKWAWIFLPWWVNPARDQQWYEDVKQDALTRTGSDDEVKEQYPSSPQEAMEAATLDKRFPPDWVNQCYNLGQPLKLDEWMHKGASSECSPLIKIYELPKAKHKYIIGVDPAEGNPTSDYSAFTVVDDTTGKQVASYSHRTDPDQLAYQIKLFAKWYNKASVMVERNNHGHTVISQLRGKVRLLVGHDSKTKKKGWLNTAFGKVEMWRVLGEALRDMNVEIADSITYEQIKSIVGTTLEAPEGLHDDDAVAFALAQVGRVYQHRSEMTETEAPEEIAEYRG